MNLGYQDPAVLMPPAALGAIAGLGDAGSDAWKQLNWSRRTAENAEARAAGRPLPWPTLVSSWSQLVAGAPPAGLTVAQMNSAKVTWQKRAAAANAARKAAEQKAAAAPVLQRVVVTATPAGVQTQTVNVQRVAPAAGRRLSIGYADPQVLAGLSGMDDGQLGSWLSHTFHEVTGVNLSTVTAGAATNIPVVGGLVANILNPGQPQQSQQPQAPAPKPQAIQAAPAAVSPALLAVGAAAAFALLGARR